MMRRQMSTVRPNHSFDGSAHIAQCAAECCTRVTQPPSKMASQIPQRCAESSSEICIPFFNPLAPFRILQNFRSLLREAGFECYKYYNLKEPEKGSNFWEALGGLRRPQVGAKGAGPSWSRSSFGWAGWCPSTSPGTMSCWFRFRSHFLNLLCFRLVLSLRLFA